jgi:hypothetical protein
VQFYIASLLISLFLRKTDEISPRHKLQKNKNKIIYNNLILTTGLTDNFELNNVLSFKIPYLCDVSPPTHNAEQAFNILLTVHRGII